MIVNQLSTNMARAIAAWGDDLPRWLHLLAAACDQTTQRSVADRLTAAGFACSHGTVSKLINNKYPASCAEPERAVLSVYGGDQVGCPIHGPIPLHSCIRARRRKGPPANFAHHQFARVCPTCPNNTDAPAEAEGTEP